MLLADEPTASLDKKTGREVVDRLRELAKGRGTTILLVTHDNRILDVADRLVHLEDGRLSTFTDAVIADNRRLMNGLAASRRKQPVEELVDGLDEAGFRALLEEVTEESQRFLEATALANDRAFRSLLERGLRAFARKVSTLLDAERTSLFLVDRTDRSLVIRVSEDLADGEEVRIPWGTGIAGAVAASGRPERVDDAYADPRFNPEVDRRSGFRTRSILCMPILDRSGEVFAVAQLLNRRDGRPFEARDEERFSVFVASIGLVLETLQGLAAVAPPRTDAGKARRGP